MKLFVIIMLFIAASPLVMAGTYENKELGVAFQYPLWAVVSDVSEKGKVKVWFKDAESPSTTGVLFELKSSDEFTSFVSRERNNQAKGGRIDDVKETELILSGKVTGIEFVRNAKSLEMIMYYLLFRSPKSNDTLSLWHTQDTSKSMTPELTKRKVERENRAVLLYEYLKQNMSFID